MAKRQVPLAFYKGGIRSEIGMVEVNDDGSFAGQVAKDHWALIKDLFMPKVGEFSINPVPAKIIDTPYHTNPKI